VYDGDVCFCFQTYFLPVIGLVDPENLTPGDLVVSAGVGGLRRRLADQCYYTLTSSHRE